MVDFKKGAFVLGAPVKIYHFDYHFDFVNPGLCFVSIPDNVFLMLVQFRQRLTVKSLKGTFYPVRFTGWEDFARETKLLMCKAFESRDLYGTFDEKKRAEKLYTPFGYL